MRWYILKCRSRFGLGPSYDYSIIDGKTVDRLRNRMNHDSSLLGIYGPFTNRARARKIMLDKTVERSPLLYGTGT